MQTHVVRSFMTASPETIAGDLTLAQARDRMFQLGAHHLPVVDNGELVGVLSDRDISGAEVHGSDLERLSVRRVMSAVPFTCGPEAHLRAVAAEMAQHRHGSAIVVDPNHPGHVLGVFTTTDALTALAQLAAPPQ